MFQIGFIYTVQVKSIHLEFNMGFIQLKNIKSRNDSENVSFYT